MYNKSSTNKLKQTIIIHIFYIYELNRLKSNSEAPH